MVCLAGVPVRDWDRQAILEAAGGNYARHNDAMQGLLILVATSKVLHIFRVFSHWVYIIST